MLTFILRTVNIIKHGVFTEEFGVAISCTIYFISSLWCCELFTITKSIGLLGTANPRVYHPTNSPLFRTDRYIRYIYY